MWHKQSLGSASAAGGEEDGDGEGGGLDDEGDADDNGDLDGEGEALAAGEALGDAAGLGGGGFCGFSSTASCLTACEKMQVLIQPFIALVHSGVAVSSPAGFSKPSNPGTSFRTRLAAACRKLSSAFPNTQPAIQPFIIRLHCGVGSIVPSLGQSPPTGT